MFKLESYITPLLLSYVDKYIKNLKPEDSQVSLWGGDAVFNNLDLRLDVLEQELRMPFNFVNGHIHELRIHVPWTKLGSEPVVITINTIECVLKLSDNGENGTVGGGSSSADGSSLKSFKLRGEPKIVNAGSMQPSSSVTTTSTDRPSSGSWIAPPTYVQSLINRVLNNISVVCNNVILKYVEDDIVLSLNVKSFEITSANVAWEQAFTDLTLPELVLRRLIRLQDLTVCLDRRNASGKITSYQDPLLYRCSLECRLYMSFDSVHGKHILSSRLDVLCGRLDFSITDQQVSMFLRLMELCLALYAKDITYQTPQQPTAGSPNESATIIESHISDAASGSAVTPLQSDTLDPGIENDPGWGSWMWSYVPTGFVGWSGEEEEAPSSDLNVPSAVCRYGVYIHRATFVIKATESQNNPNAAFGMQRVTFRPLCCFRTDGVFLDVTSRGIDVFAVQIGISRICGSLSGVCACGVHDCIDKSPELNGFFTAGNSNDDNEDYRYLINSLFDEKSPENCMQHHVFVFDWDEHFSRPLKQTIGLRASAVLFDYFYLMEFPNDLSDESSDIDVTDLEHSNLKERAKMQIVIGPTKLDITSSVVHRAQLVFHAASLHNYEPYSKPKNDISEHSSFSSASDELAAMEAFIPSRTICVVIVEPIVHIFVADHPYANIPVAKRRTISQKPEIYEHHPLPILIISADNIHLQRSYAMYPRRVARTTSLIWPPPEHLFDNCHYHFSIKCDGCGLRFSHSSSSNEYVVIAPCDVALHYKWLLHEYLFKSPMIPRKDIHYEVPRISLRLTGPQVELVKGFYKSWFTPDFHIWSLSESSLTDDVFDKTRDYVECVVLNVDWRRCYTNVVSTYVGSIDLLNVTLISSGGCGEFVGLPLLIAPANVSEHLFKRDGDSTPAFCTEITRSSSDRAFRLTLQLPRDASASTSEPNIFIVSVKGMVGHIDPSISSFVSYRPEVYDTPGNVERFWTRSNVENQVSEICGDGGSLFSSSATHVCTDPTSKTPRIQQPSRTSGTNPPTNNRFSTIFVDWYPLLDNLIVKIDFHGMRMFVSNNPFQWIHEKQPEEILKFMFLTYETLIINLPAVSIMNGSQKATSLKVDDLIDLPLTTIEGWSVSIGDKFPWKVELMNVSVMCSTILHCRRAEYCLSPGYLTSTIAVTSKSDGDVPNVSQLSICVHCDIKQVQISLSTAQAHLISSILKYYVKTLHSAATLFRIFDVDKVKFDAFSIPLAKSQTRLINRMESMTSDVVETMPDNAIVTATSMEIHEIETKNTFKSRELVKVSVWVQTTLPKLSVDVIGEENHREVRLRLELEDISSSIDVQDVYSKIKLKIASANSMNYTRHSHDSEWVLGPFEGITLCCADRIATSLYTRDPKTGTRLICPHSSMESDVSLHEQSSRGSFLTATFTRAQCRNVQKRWAKVLRDSSGSELGNRLSMGLCDDSSNHMRFISEIDLKIMPCDCVVWTPLLYTVTDVFASLAAAFLNLKAVMISISNALPEKEEEEEELNALSMPLLSSSTLPLIYVNLSTIRVFFPVDDKAKKMKVQQSVDDFLMLQVDSVYLTPNVDNLLSRVIIKSDLFSMAQRAGIIHIPGSEIEDRQYQLDVTGFGLMTGQWNELMLYTKKTSPPHDVTKLKTMGENPALEWNTKLRPHDSDQVEDDDDVILCPLVWRFDVRAVAAPAIVFDGITSNHKQNPNIILVAAHSLEINVTTDIAVYAGMHHLIMFQNLMDADTSHDAYSEQDLLVKDVVRDSGIDSETSTLNPLIVDKGTSSVLQMKPVVQSSANLINSVEVNPTPFEILLTARCVTLTAYSPDYLMPITMKQKTPVVSTRIATNRARRSVECFGDQSTSTDDSPARIDKPRRKRPVRHEPQRFSEMEGYEGSEEDSQDDDSRMELKDDDTRLIPLFYLYVCQPYALLKWHDRTQKLEISCYDTIVKGRRVFKKGRTNCVSSRFKLPTIEDYGVVLFDTLPGDIDRKTGVPPALYTITAVDFYRKCSVHVKVERPWRINFSNEIYKETLLIITLLNTYFYSKQKDEKSDEPASDYKLITNFRSIFSGFHEIGYETSQAVFSYNVDAQLILAVSQSTGSVIFQCESSRPDGDGQERMNAINNCEIKMEFGGLVIQTKCNDQEARTVIGPLSLASSLTFAWNDWNVCSPYPHLLWKLDVDTVFVNVDQLQLQCLNIILRQLMDDTNNDAQQPEFGSCETSSLDKWFSIFRRSKLVQKQIWQDDLRVGTFQYTQHLDDTNLMIPSLNEIIFCKEHDGMPASMTWKYPQPRCLTRVEIQPVPFRAVSVQTTQGDDEILSDDEGKCEVRCALQLYDELQRRFVTYRVFELSEAEHCVLDVPPVDDASTCKDFVVAQTWRVVMDFSEEAFDNNPADSKIPHRGLVSPLALAACMRIDSCFDACFVPIFECLIAIDLIRTTLSNHFKNRQSQSKSIGRSNFLLDGTIPEYQEFLIVTFENVNVRYHQWMSMLKLDLESTFVCELIDYKYLTLHHLVQPSTANLQLFAIDRRPKPIIVEASIDFDPIFIHLSQSAVHTLTNALTAFACENFSDSVIVMNRYMITNRTQETLCFGQVGTDESVTLQSDRSHAYSWRSHRMKQVLHLCVAGMRWKWSDPFGIETIGIQIRIIKCNSKKATLFIDVRERSATQIEVIIEGQLTVSNKLDIRLDLQILRPTGSPIHDDDSNEKITVLNGNGCTQSFAVQHNDSWKFQLRLSERGEWSQIINVNDIKAGNDSSILMNVTRPFEVSIQRLGFWIHIFSKPILIGDVIIEKQLLVIAPLFLVRSHLPYPLILEMHTPTVEQMISYELRGMGQEHQIVSPGEPNLEHEIRFRLQPGLEVSNPSLPLTSNTFEKAIKLPPPSDTDIETFYDDSVSNNPYLPFWWPYDDDSRKIKSVSLLKCHTPTLYAQISSSNFDATGELESIFHGNIDLEVSLCQRWPGCKSVVIDVKPWALLVNRTSLDIVFSANKNIANVTKDSVFALPKIEKFFKLGLMFGDDIFYSDVIELSSEDFSMNRFWPRADGVLPMNGHVTCDIRIEMLNVTKICRLAMTASVKEGIRIFTVQSQFTVINETMIDIVIGTFSVPNIGKKLRLDCSDVTAMLISKDCPPTALLFWDLFNVAEENDVSTDICVNYVLFSMDTTEPHWGYPCRIELSENPDRIYSISVLQSVINEDSSCEMSTHPLRVSVHWHRGHIFMFVKKDKYPQLHFHNNCNFALHFGQRSITNPETGDDYVIHEELELLDILPILGPHSSCFYTFPFVVEKIPAIFDPRLLPKVHFSKACGNHLETITWSAGLSVSTSGDQFMNIPNCGDIKVHVEMAEGVVHVFLDPVNRVEVSAKEIRSRITPKEKSPTSILAEQSSTTLWRKPVKQKILVTMKKTLKNPDMASAIIDLNHQRANPQNKELKQKAIIKERVCLYANIYLKHVCFILLDEVSEILRISVDNINTSTRPASVPSIDRLVPLQRQEILACVTNIQVDNQLHSAGEHDFSVVFIRQDPPMCDLSTSADACRKDSLIVISVLLEKMKTTENDQKHRSWFVHSVELTIKPVAAYIEDTLLYKLSAYCRSFALPEKSIKNEVVDAQFGLIVPEEVFLRAANLGSPLVMQHFIVNATSVLLSVHVSMKFFVSLNSTPLSFKTFERLAINTTWYRLGHALTMHYLSGALVRAGWVIGSLDLLANPGGFARAVSTGIADFVRLPYQGMTRGPWAFVLGVVHGSSSLIRHVGSGTLLSITNLAENVSRNMDRLSLDDDHLRRNDEIRRCSRPAGVASGLAQGLTGLGIGLLGAIAGIVDQPLQSIQEGVEHQALVCTAAGIVSGVGRGLVGIVTKPIGGAAELVAQTGQGILRGAGWAQVLRCRYEPSVEDPSSRVNSTLKYVWKMLPTGESLHGSRVFAIEATHFNSGSVQYAAAVLLLTDKVLYIVSTEADAQQQTFSLDEIDCCGHGSDPTLVYFVTRCESGPETAVNQLNDRNRDRIAEFIDKSSKYAYIRSPPSSATSKLGDELESISEASSSQASQVPISSASARFYVNPRLRLPFLSLYRMAQRRLLGKGYPT